MNAPANEIALEELLSEPYPETVELMKRLTGDILILGVAGKVGPSLARLAKRACEEAGVRKRIIGVARFSDPAQRDLLEAAGIETITCDLSDAEQVAALPQCTNVIFLAGRKFGEVGSEPLTWIMNVIVPANVAQVFTKSRIVAYSTGCVYPLVPPDAPGCTEETPAAPVGEYANSCLGRERMFEYYSQKSGTPVVQYRLNYAVDLRYGVLPDIARTIWEGRPVSLAVPTFNCLWQGDANNRTLLCLEHTSSPPAIMNITGPETLSTREIAEEFGRLFGKPVQFTGTPGEKVFLNDASRSMKLFGPPKVNAETLVKWTADWIRAGGRDLNKPTHFQVTDGQFLDEANANTKTAASPQAVH